MSWSGGTYTKGNNATGGWTGDASLGIGIEAGRHDTQDNDFATGINTCLTKDGQNAATADLPMGGFKHTNVAVATARNNYAAVSQVQDSGFVWLGTTAGSANAQTASAAPAITAYAAGQKFRFKAGFTNTGAVTLNVNGVAAKNIFDIKTNAALKSDQILVNYIYEVIYDGTQFVLLQPNTMWISYTPTITQGSAVTKTVTYAKYRIEGSVCHAQVSVSLTGAGGAGSVIQVSLPINSSTAVYRNVGSAAIYRSAVTTYLVGGAFFDSVGASYVVFAVNTSTTNFAGGSPSFALANNDAIVFNISYEI
jgi:hypothetical protein